MLRGGFLQQSLQKNTLVPSDLFDNCHYANTGQQKNDCHHQKPATHAKTEEAAHHFTRSVHHDIILSLVGYNVIIGIPVTGRSILPVVIVRGGIINFGAKGYDTGGIYGFVAAVIVLFDVIHVHRFGDARLLVEIADIF